MRRSQWWALAAAAGLLAAAAVYGQSRPAAGVPEAADLVSLRSAASLAACPAGLGPDLPAGSLPCLGGGPDVRLDARTAGQRPMLVNLWGTWCRPCVDEVPYLVAFSERAAGRVDVVGVLTVDTARNGLAFAAEYGMRYANVVDQDALLRSELGPGVPKTLLLDGDGRIAHVQAGEFTSLQQIEDVVARELGVRL